MVYRVLSDAVVVIHLTFHRLRRGGRLPGVALAMARLGARPRRRLGRRHHRHRLRLPLTPLENGAGLRERGGEAAYEGGFVDRYVEGVVYPEEYTPHLRALAILLIVIAYARIGRVGKERADISRSGRHPAVGDRGR